jgi:hypothetical protein
MNDSTYKPTLCVGADVHLDEIVLRAVDKALGHRLWAGVTHPYGIVTVWHVSTLSPDQ